MAWLAQYKAKQKVYVYLQEYNPKEENAKKTQNIYSLGKKETSLLMLKGWLKDFPANFPLQLKEKGFGRVDLEEWIKTLETGVTKTGRSRSFKVS